MTQVTGVVVREATLDDADAIAHIHVACWRHTYAGLMPQELLDSLDESARAEQWRRMLATGGVEPVALRTLVSVDADDRVTGFAQVGPETPGEHASCSEPHPPERHGDVGVLYAIYLDPPVIGTGVGRTLLGAAMAHLRDMDVDCAVLDVLPGNTRAREVYERAGWLAIGEPWDVQHGAHVLPHQRYELRLR
ncbi:MAG: acetyltransferase [Thermoleophilia bacterium]|nr:acetyltransferase [Thermoleophilia bacterium]